MSVRIATGRLYARARRAAAGPMSRKLREMLIILSLYYRKDP